MTYILRVGLGAAMGLCLLMHESAHAQEPPPDFPKLDLTLYGGAMISTAPQPHVDDAGLSLGLSAIVRLTGLFGLGLALEHNVFGWDAQGSSDGTYVQGSAFPDEDGSISHQLALLAARLYFVQAEVVDVHAQLGLGYGALTYTPDHPDCSENDDIAAQLALGMEYRATRALGLHLGLAAWPYGLGMGCNDIAYEGMPPSAPYMKLALGLRAGVTTVWD